MEVATAKKQGSMSRGLAPGFPDRLNAAMAAKGVKVPELAAQVGCTRALLSNYLRGVNKSIDGVISLKLCMALDVAGQWLLMNKGQMRRHAQITIEESEAVDIYRSFKDEAARDMWMQQGKMLSGLTRS